jgi:transposase-like protein
MHKLARLTPMGRLRMVRRLEAGGRLCDVAAALDLSTTSVRRWWRRYQQEGVAGLSDRSSRPHRSPRAARRCAGRAAH